MARVATFSRQFPQKHLCENEPTFFVEKILCGLDNIQVNGIEYFHSLNPEMEFSQLEDFYTSLNFWHLNPKITTIRAEFSRKLGDFFSPRVWVKPYKKNFDSLGNKAPSQIVIAPPLQITSVRKFEISDGVIYVDGFKKVTADEIDEIAANDGLSTEQLLSWFKFPNDFSGQIIGWTK